MLCTFDEDINTCPNYDRAKKKCTAKDTKCCFAQQEIINKYVRKERWYEKYTR